MVISATFLGVLETIGYVLIGLLALMFMVVVHELGHYIAGKILGFKILEFGIGFGPALFKKTNKKPFLSVFYEFYDEAGCKLGFLCKCHKNLFFCKKTALLPYSIDQRHIEYQTSGVQR